MTTSFATTSLNKQLMLVTEEDWPGWIEMVHTTATHLDVWRYIHPEKEATELPELPHPVRPRLEATFPQLNLAPEGILDHAKFAALTTQQIKLFDYLDKQWSYDKAEYDAVIKGLRILINFIKSTSARPRTKEIIGSGSKHGLHAAHYILNELKKDLATSARNIELDLTAKYQVLKRGPPNARKLRTWLLDWETLHKRATEAGRKPRRGSKIKMKTRRRKRRRPRQRRSRRRPQKVYQRTTDKELSQNSLIAINTDDHSMRH
jgi:hypothetical protein